MKNVRPMREVIPRIAPTPEHRQAIVGLWDLEGERILMLAEPDTGILVARDKTGQRVNPMRVITRGRKCDGAPESHTRTA